MALIDKNTPCLILAPMEGVTQAPMRALLTSIGGFKYCVSEFLRVSQEPVSKKVFRRDIPESNDRWETTSMVPIQPQILGGNPQKMAQSALLAYQLGAPGIDINFGCPAPTVNRHDGGATLLLYPERIYEIVSTIRQAVPRTFSVSVKMRLGWDNIDAIHKNAEMAEKAGANWITIHARTKTQGYRPPVFWEKIGAVKKEIGIPVIANGDIWSIEDFRICQDITQCRHFMLGRGSLNNPFLPSLILNELENKSEGLIKNTNKPNPTQWLQILSRYRDLLAPTAVRDRYIEQKIKQWGKLISLVRPNPWYELIKNQNDLELIFLKLHEWVNVSSH